MKATGIVRRIDELGRVVIPKEIRRTLRIREGDPLEIFVDQEGEVILKKYSQIGELGDFSKEYADSLYETLGHISLIADRNSIIAVSGAPKKEFLNKQISKVIEKIMEERKAVIINSRQVNEASGWECTILEDDEDSYAAEVVAPIIAGGDPIGAIIIATNKPGAEMGEMELKLAETAAGFLAKQMEQ